MPKELTKRQQDLLRVAPAIWGSLFGGYLYQLQVATEHIDSNPEITKQRLAELSKDLATIRNFLMEGDKP